MRRQVQELFTEGLIEDLLGLMSTGPNDVRREAVTASDAEREHSCLRVFSKGRELRTLICFGLYMFVLQTLGDEKT